MIYQVLANFAYVFYPKNVCPWDERDKYLETIEYKRLKKIIDSFDSALRSVPSQMLRSLCEVS